MVRRWPAAAAASSRSPAAVAASARRDSSLPGTATRSEGAQSGGATGRVLFTTTSRAAGSACVLDDGAVLEAARDDAAALAEPEAGVAGDGPAAGVPQPATSSASAASAARGRVRRMDQTFLSSTRVTSCCAFFVSTSRARPRVGRTFCSRFGPLMESQMDSAVA